MKKMLAALLHYFRNEVHLEYMIVFRHLLRKFPDAEAVVAALLADFDPLLAQEGAAL
ncbi:MAG: hypothetical protein LBF90_00060 [Prevotellaceae bacterium]|jgi:hypothetical protein|nr:hypothetical protein [Prevotellaceae bacterium]